VGMEESGCTGPDWAGRMASYNYISFALQPEELGSM